MSGHAVIAQYIVVNGNVMKRKQPINWRENRYVEPVKEFIQKKTFFA